MANQREERAAQVSILQTGLSRSEGDWNYHAHISGGYGNNTWHIDLYVWADTIKQALELIEAQLLQNEMDCWVDLIESTDELGTIKVMGS